MRPRTNVFTVYFTGVSGTAPGTSVPSTSARYGNSSSSSYFPSGTAPFSTGISSTSADPKTTTISGSRTPSANATSYGTVSGAPYKTKVSGNTTIASTGKAHAKRTIASTGDPSAKTRSVSGTAASTGFASAPSSFGTSGKLTYTAPTGIPSEYYYHHKKPKRDVSRSSYFQRPKEMRGVLTESTQAYYGGY